MDDLDELVRYQLSRVQIAKYFGIPRDKIMKEESELERLENILKSRYRMAGAGSVIVSDFPKTTYKLDFKLFVIFVLYSLLCFSCGFVIEHLLKK